MTVLALGFLAAVAEPAGDVRAEDNTFSAVEHDRRTIYHSPQSPGFTSWVGAWTMPDASLMVSFTQATGPVKGRRRAPKDVQQRLTWPPEGRPGYDMTGLDLRNVHLRSTDAGKTWKQVSADAFVSCMNGITGEAQTALADGTIVRGVWGYYLPYNPELPKTGYLERSTDGTQTWGKPEVLLDAEKYSAWPKRLRMLRDGRLLVIGGVANVPANSRTRAEYNGLFEPLLLVSSDQGRTWKGPIPVIPAEHRHNWGGEEFDAAELANGDLLCVFRRSDPNNSGGEVRWQGSLDKSGDTWLPGAVGPAPFPHSGHPDVLATREGPILHVGTAGIHWTADAGHTWHTLDVPGTAYYPRAVQAADGRIFIFGHVGGDDAYGTVDQSIVMDSFRLVKNDQDTRPVLEQQPLFTSGAVGYHTYRIPSLVVTPRGTVLAFCEARKQSASDHGDVDLALRRSNDGGTSWSTMEIVADNGEHTIGNPCPVVDRQTGVIWLPFCRDNKHVLLMKSEDDGQSWSKPVEITHDVKDPTWHWVGTGPGHGIQLRSGRLLIPCWADATPNLGEVQISFAFYSDDAGQTWVRGEALQRDASDECEAVELSDDRLYLTLRSRQGKKQRGYSFSRDGGHSWSAVNYDPNLPEPSCQGSIIRLTEEKEDGTNRILLAAPANQDARTHLTVYLSTDECQSWPVSKVLHAGSSAYSDLAVTKDREVLLLYEADQYSRLTLARFNLQWLSENAGPQSAKPPSASATIASRLNGVRAKLCFATTTTRFSRKVR